MINIGIDVGKSKHCASVFDDHTGEWIYVSFFFTNDKAGFESLYEKIKPYLNRKHAVGMECTGHYMYNLVHFLLEKKCTVMYINPLATHLRRKELGKTAKNDKLDSKLISEMLSEKQFWQHVTKHSLELDELRELTRVYQQLTEQQNQDQNRLQRALDIVFPEYTGLSWKSYGTAYMNVLKKYPSAAIIASTDIRSLRNVLATKGRGRKTSVTAEILKSAAKDSIGDAHNVAVELEIQSVIAVIEAREEQIDILEKKIEEFSHQLNSSITSIPGIGAITGMSILAEIGDITRFSDASKLISFAGMAPGVYQSGNYDAAHLPISKHGSRYLRKALYEAIFTVCNYSPTFKKYFNGKQSQGKQYRCAQGHAVRKLLRVIYKLLSTGTQYDPALCL
jgi:transposase